MSMLPTPVDEELFNYITEHFSGEDDVLKNLKEEAKLAGLPSIAISPDQGRFLQVMLKSINAKNVLEIGTLGGYSAISMARALPDDGTLITVEIEFERAVFAKNQVEKAGLSHIIQIQNSKALDFLKNYEFENEFDFVFCDADKSEYAKILDLVTPHIRKGGIFAADNAFAFGFLLDTKPERNPEDVKSMLSFNQYFKNKKEYLTCIVPNGDGIIMGIKL